MKSLARFFVSVKKEMGKVRWPKRKEMFQLSVATILIICFFMLFFEGANGIIGAFVKVFS